MRQPRNHPPQMNCLLGTLYEESNLRNMAVSTRNPKTLYKLSLDSFVSLIDNKSSTTRYFRSIRLLPVNLLSDVLFKMSMNPLLLDVLQNELKNIETFERLLKHGCTTELIKTFSALATNFRYIGSDLVDQYLMKRDELIAAAGSTSSMTSQLYAHIKLGMNLGLFMLDAGWMQESIQVLDKVSKTFPELAKLSRNELLLKLECMQRLLHAQAKYCVFEDSNDTIKTGNDIITLLGEATIPKSLMASWSTQKSMLSFVKSDYDLCFTECCKALNNIDQSTPGRIAVDALRQASKACVLRRDFRKAHLLITSSVRLAKFKFGENHYKTADALLDYAFYLLNVDEIQRSVEIYQLALKVRTSIFGPRNILTAVSHEDLAYGLYVQEYSSGRFQSARDHIELAIRIMTELTPYNHLTLASAKRVKALILEEIAIDNDAPRIGEGLLQESEELHNWALELSLQTFGEFNVQTAKHFGNLGRLYQSMLKFEEAETMHSRAISIKTAILGPLDYEVGLSIGHLASLYNYHMEKFREAEELYLRSIDISLKLFGPAYSGLEYDYRGLRHLYEALEDQIGYTRVSADLLNWNALRETQAQNAAVVRQEIASEEFAIADVTSQFFDECRRNNELKNE